MRKIVYFSLIIVILALIIGGVFYWQDFLAKKQPSTSENIIENLSPELQKKIKKEQEKIRSIDGKVEKIEERILTIKVMADQLKDKIFQVTLIPEAVVKQTKIDPKTGIPKTSDFSFEKIKVDDEIIAWSKEDIRGKDGFETEYLEVIMR
jgi:hypothetical protein